MAKSSARTIRAGSAFVEITTDDSKLAQGLARAQKRLESFGASVTAVGTRVAAVGSAVVTAFTAAATQFSSWGDQLDKMSARTGVSVESLSQLAYAADQSGTSIDALGQALFRMRRRVANAATGSGPAVRAIEALGLSAEELTKLPVEEQFLTIADALQNVGNESLAAQYGFEILGDNFRALQPLLAGGRKGLEAYMKRADELNLTMTREQATAAAELNDAWGTLRDSMKAATVQIGAAVAPQMTGLADRITELVQRGIAWIKQNGDMLVGLLKLSAQVAVVGTALVALGKGISIVGTLVGTLATLAKTATVVTTAIGAMTAAKAAALASTATLAGAVGALVAALGLAAASYARARAQSVSFGEAVRRNVRDLTGLQSAADRHAEATRELSNARLEQRRLQSALDSAETPEDELRITKAIMQNLQAQARQRAAIAALEGKTDDVQQQRILEQFRELNERRKELQKLVDASRVGVDGEAGDVSIDSSAILQEFERLASRLGEIITAGVTAGIEDAGPNIERDIARYQAQIGDVSGAIDAFRADAQSRFSFGASAIQSLESGPSAAEQETAKHAAESARLLKRIERQGRTPAFVLA